MEMCVFARFHARAGQDEALAVLLREQLQPSRAEPGCLRIDAFRSTRDPALFYFHSRWVDEAAFDTHAGLPHTVRFLKQVQRLIDHPLDIARVRQLGSWAS